MNMPKNVWWFEILLYASLVLDALSVAFQDRTPTMRMSEQMIDGAVLVALGLLLFLFWCVWLAAQRRKSWPRWVLLVALVLSVLSLAQVIAGRGMQFDVLVDTVSCALTAIGLYLSFTGDAKDWFDRDRVDGIR